MRLFRKLAALAALALAAPALLPAQAPVCRGALDGDWLTTTIEFPNGYIVEGPWRIGRSRPVALEDGTSGIAMNATLDRIVEVQPGTRERVTTPFPEPIETTFDGRNEQSLVQRAAQIWCLTVLRAQQNQHRNEGRGGRAGG